MKKPRALALGGAAVVAALVSVAALQAVARPSVPRHVVARGAFKNEVLAYGQLQAVKSTPMAGFIWESCVR